MSRILVLNGEERGLTLAIEDELTIGRSSANGLRLNGTQISREHARIFRENGIFHVADLGSRNGIFVNGEKVAKRALKAGDELQVGNFILVFDPPYEFHVSPAGEGQPVVVRKEGHAHEALVTAEAKEVLAQEFSSRDDLGATMDVDALRIAHRRLRAVYQVGTMINQILDIDDLLNRVVELVLDILRGDRCVILLSKGEELKVAAIATARDATPGAGAISISKTVLDLAWGDGEGG
ncbi:MAG: FHA domain-containing protein, partial [Planctomycetes bacterium]|nr:FHA domain-containing protein [Planctomycetota bacterium]